MSILQKLAELARLKRQNPPPEFVCPVCKSESWHKEDKENGFCAQCNGFTGESE